MNQKKCFVKNLTEMSRKKKRMIATAEKTERIKCYLISSKIICIYSQVIPTNMNKKFLYFSLIF